MVYGTPLIWGPLSGHTDASPQLLERLSIRIPPSLTRPQHNSEAKISLLNPERKIDVQMYGQ